MYFKHGPFKFVLLYYVVFVCDGQIYDNWNGKICLKQCIEFVYFKVKIVFDSLIKFCLLNLIFLKGKMFELQLDIFKFLTETDIDFV